MMIHNILICYSKLGRIYNNCSITNSAQPLINTAIKHQYQMPTNTSLMRNNHSLTTSIKQAVIVQYIKSGPTNATSAPYNYT